MSDDELSISFASSIEHIRNEFLGDADLYEDLDQLEKSIDAEFDEYIQRAQTFPSQTTSSIDQMKQNIDTWQRYLHNKSHNRPTSPGEYFGARSLPMDSVNNVWQNKSVGEEERIEKDIENQSQDSKTSKAKTEIEKLLDTRFKSLPSSIRLFPKSYTQPAQKQSPISSHGVRSFTNSSTNSDQPTYTIEPSSPLHFLCEMSSAAIYAKVIHLKITNLHPNSTRHFALYSQKSLIEFELQEGVIVDTVQIKIKVKSSALLSYQRQNEELDPLTDKILIIIDGEVNERAVNIDFISLEDEEEQKCKQERPKCRFCALEQGYPLHCLQ